MRPCWQALAVKMKTLIKILSYLFGLVLVISFCGYLYIFRDQAIDTSLIPLEFEYCGNQIYGKDESYLEIVDWLKANKDGWVLSFASYVPNHRYYHGAFNVNIHEEAVIVSYKTDYGYPQYIKQGKHDLAMSCSETANKRLKAMDGAGHRPLA